MIRTKVFCDEHSLQLLISIRDVSRAAERDVIVRALQAIKQKI